MRKKTSVLKGFVAGILVTVLLSGTFVMANPVARELFFGVTININGESVEFAADSQPFIIDDRMFLPVGAMATAFGFEVEWDGEASTAVITKPVIDLPVAPPADLPADPPEQPVVPQVNPITSAEITALQVAWGEGLVAIATAFAEGEDYATIAQGVLDTLYGYVDGIVLFKPTIASDVPFRFAEIQAASYFIGSSVGDAAYEEDGQGFATNQWTDVRFCEDGKYIINGETALWMGSVYITNADGDVTRVEKSLGLYRDSDGDVRIQLHHSSLPFVAE